MATRRASRKAERKPRRASASRKVTRKQKGGKRAMTPWNKLVKRTFDEMRRKDRSASFSDALKEASRRKERGEM
jgi:hypothetical protein